MSLMFASEQLRADRTFVMEVVSRDGEALKFASNDLKMDREIVLNSVRSRRTADSLAWAPAVIKCDHEIAFAAVNTHGKALQRVSNNLKADREIVLAAVSICVFSTSVQATSVQAKISKQQSD